MQPRLGFDLDGVLAAFVPSFTRLLEQQTGQSHFPEDWQDDPIFPAVWHWPQHYGYSSNQVEAAWGTVKASRTFWATLDPIRASLDALHLVPKGARVYFVTSRVGDWALRQTQQWLSDHLLAYWDVEAWSALVCSDKEAAARALRLQFYIDDYHVNAADVARVRDCRSYLLDQPYNRVEMEGVVRVASVDEALRDWLSR
uniref:5' nucleotidase n=1 Tax=viral metagenome TaxID=1070528 RepID=A0A6M3LYZ8_9ZZZZ